MFLLYFFVFFFVFSTTSHYFVSTSYISSVHFTIPQGIEEMRVVRLPYAGLAPSDTNTTDFEYRSKTDLTLHTSACMQVSTSIYSHSYNIYFILLKYVLFLSKCFINGPFIILFPFFLRSLIIMSLCVILLTSKYLNVSVSFCLTCMYVRARRLLSTAAI